MDKLYTINEVAEKLNLSDKTLRRWEEAGRFTPSRTLGNQRRYSIEDLQILDAIKHGTIPDQKDLLTSEQAAKFCGVSTLTITRWENLGKIHPLITSGTTYYPRHKLLEKMNELKQVYVYSEPEVPVGADYHPPELASPVEEHVIPTALEMTPKLTPLSLNTRADDNPPLQQYKTLKPYITQALITIICILLYHLLMTHTAPKSISPLASPTSNVQGASTIDPRLDILEKKFQDFAAADMLYKARPTNTTVNLNNATLISGTGEMARSKDQVIIENSKIIPTSIVTVSFTGDYAPAKKYWTTVTTGSFTLHTDFPVGTTTSFNYFLL